MEGITIHTLLGLGLPVGFGKSNFPIQSVSISNLHADSSALTRTYSIKHVWVGRPTNIHSYSNYTFLSMSMWLMYILLNVHIPYNSFILPISISMYSVYIHMSYILIYTSHINIYILCICSQAIHSHLHFICLHLYTSSALPSVVQL